MKPAVFTPAAEADVEEWYEAQRMGLGAAFRHAVDIAVAALEANPEAYAVLHRNTRRVLLPKFPYGLYYRVVGDQPVVVGCIHAKRHAGFQEDWTPPFQELSPLGFPVA